MSDVGGAIERHLEAWAGLEFSVPVDDEGKAGVADPDVLDQGVEGLEVDGGLEDEDLAHRPVRWVATMKCGEPRRPAKTSLT